MVKKDRFTYSDNKPKIRFDSINFEVSDILVPSLDKVELLFNAGSAYLPKIGLLL